MKKHEYSFVYNFFRKNNCKLLSKEYWNVRTHLQYICKCGNKSSICFKHFKRGHRCMKCGGKEKLTFEFVNEYFKQNDCQLLSTEYLNSHSKLRYICKCGNKSSIRFFDFKNGNRCIKCSGSEKHTFEYVNEYFKNNNCELLSKEYLTAHAKLDYICKCGNKSSMAFSNFKNGHRCMKCSGSEKFTFEYVSDYFKKNNCELLSKEYLNAHAKLDYICKCGNKSSICFKNFKQGQRCMKCRYK
jgi:hypothetical protein